MRISTTEHPDSTDLSWMNNEQEISVTIKGYADGKYANRIEMIIVVENSDIVSLFYLDGTLVDRFYIDMQDGVKYYTIQENPQTTTGVSLVFGHSPEIDGEIFWQYEIDVNNKKIGNRISKWR